MFNIFTVTMDQITIRNVKGVTRGDEPRENYYLDLQLPSALQSFISFSASGFDFFDLVHSHVSYQCHFQMRLQ